jgi:hypothetical protein
MRSPSITTLASPHPCPSGRVTQFWPGWKKQSLPAHGSILYPRCTSTPRIRLDGSAWHRPSRPSGGWPKLSSGSHNGDSGGSAHE